MNKKKVLIVDDQKSIRKIVNVILRQMNYEVFEAQDGAEGIEKSKRDYSRLDFDGYYDA